MIFQKIMQNKFLFVWIIWIGVALISSSCEDIEVSYPGNTQDISPSKPKGNLKWSIEYDEDSNVGQLPENLQGTNTSIGVIEMDDNNPDDEIKSVSIQSQKITDNDVTLFTLENDSLDQWKLILLSSAIIDYETIHGQNNASTKCDIVLEITDDSPTEEKGILTFAVEIKNINEAPEWTNTSILTANIDESIEFTSVSIYYRDVDIGDNPVMSSEDMPDWISIQIGQTNNNGDRSYYLAGTPSNSDIGSKQFTLKLIDGGDEEITRPFTITVIENQAPYFTNELNNEWEEELNESWNINFTDYNSVDRSSLTASVSLDEQELEEYGLTFSQPNNSYARISGRIPTQYAGQTITFDITIADDRSGNPLSTTESIEILVDPNDAPEFSDNTAPPQSINHGCDYDYSITWSDPDGDDVTFTWDNNVNWLSVNSNGILSGTPSESYIGSTEDIILTITDDRPNASESTVFSFSISVQENFAPEFTDLSSVDTTAIVGVLYEAQFPVDDQNSDNITFTVPTKPNWLSVDFTTNRVYGTPSLSDVGTDTVIVKAEDCGESTSFEFAIEVSESE